MVEALYLKGDIVEKVLAKSITRKLYFQKYRGYLFCPIEGCNAHLSFVEHKKNNHKFFRTWSKSKHRKGCPNEIEYDDEYAVNNNFKGKLLFNISDEHINKCLKRAYEQFNDKIVTIIRTPINKIYKKEIGKIKKLNGQPSLFNEGKELIEGKEPYILIRKYNDLDETDYGHVRCVFGYVHNMYLLNRHGYINLTGKIDNSIKIYFCEDFVVNNQVQFDHFNLIKTYIDECKKNNKNVICLCIGKIFKVKSGINRQCK